MGITNGRNKPSIAHPACKTKGGNLSSTLVIVVFFILCFVKKMGVMCVGRDDRGAIVFFHMIPFNKWLFFLVYSNISKKNNLHIIKTEPTSWQVDISGNLLYSLRNTSFLKLLII